MPTEQCNFRCTYCFEHFEHGRMKPSVVAGMKRLLDRRAAELALLEIDWFGGEPLLATDIVEEIQCHAQSLARRHSGLRLRSSLTTNGYLLDQSRMARLLELGVDYFHIAIDGPAEFHDRKRCLANGRGTFDRIWANLRAARVLDGAFQITVRFQLDRDNRRAITEFLKLFAADFGEDRRFELAFVPLRCTHAQAADAGAFFDEEESEAAPLEAQNRAEQMDLAVYGPPPAITCHAARGNAFIVRSNGALAKCPVALSDPGNLVGRLLEDGTVEIDDLKMNLWLRGLWSEDEAELSCPLIGLPSYDA
jgi:uncharacterized protein